MTSSEYRNDPMFLRNHFKGDGTFEMPKIRREEIDLEKIELIGYDRLSGSRAEQIVHFFLDDYKFEVLWNDMKDVFVKMMCKTVGLRLDAAA